MLWRACHLCQNFNYSTVTHFFTQSSSGIFPVLALVTCPFAVVLQHPHPKLWQTTLHPCRMRCW